MIALLPLPYAERSRLKLLYEIPHNHAVSVGDKVSPKEPLLPEAVGGPPVKLTARRVHQAPILAFRSKDWTVGGGSSGLRQGSDKTADEGTFGWG